MRFLLTIMLLSTLCSCAYSEPNAKFTVTAIGLSASDDKKSVFIQAVDTEQAEDKGKTFTVSGQGNIASLALRDVKTKLSKEPSFEHCQLIVVSRGIEKLELVKGLELCEEIGIPLQTKVVYTPNAQSLLTNEKITDATKIVSLLKQNYRHLGFGEHTALFEIITAVITNDGNFALPFLSATKQEIKISGLLKYQNNIPEQWLDLEESRLYAKEIAK